MRQTAIILLIVFLALACNRDYTPKPRSYFRIDFPEKTYINYSSDCPFSFNIPSYASVHPDTTFDAEPCWKHIYFEPFSAYFHLSYKPVSTFDDFRSLTEDARTFVYEHTVRASNIERRHLNIDGETAATIFRLDGEAASALQFYATDTTAHYMRGALYFDAPANRDSLQPVIDFLYEDMVEFLKSIKWETLPNDPSSYPNL